MINIISVTVAEANNDWANQNSNIYIEVSYVAPYNVCTSIYSTIDNVIHVIEDNVDTHWLLRSGKDNPVTI